MCEFRRAKCYGRRCCKELGAGWNDTVYWILSAVEPLNVGLEKQFRVSDDTDTTHTTEDSLEGGAQKGGGWEKAKKTVGFKQYYK